jgi:acetate kinase
MTGPAKIADEDRGSILVLNAGSSSLKFALFSSGPSLDVLVRGEISELENSPHLIARDHAGLRIADRHLHGARDRYFADAIDATLAVVGAVPGHDRIGAVGHRIVHGGADHINPEHVTLKLLTALDALVPLDPLHMPHSLEPIRALSKVEPEVRQIACFDTAFHHTMPPAAKSFALPRALHDAGIRRYGFHGLSYEYVAGQLAQNLPTLAGGRVIVAHLGAGASLCALDKGISIATTFGFSVLDGLMMATRCGSLDPGIIFYLGRLGHSLAEIEDMLYTKSGLLGFSGISGDIRVLLASDAPAAHEAIDLFTYRIALEVGAMVSALGGVDGIVFTAGIGQNAPTIRAAVCARLTWLGLRLDEAANASGASCISSQTSQVAVHVIPTDEEGMIARHVLKLMDEPSPDGGSELSVLPSLTSRKNSGAD